MQRLETVHGDCGMGAGLAHVPLQAIYVMPLDDFQGVVGRRAHPRSIMYSARPSMPQKPPHAMTRPAVSHPYPSSQAARRPHWRPTCRKSGLQSRSVAAKAASAGPDCGGGEAPVFQLG